MSLVIFNGRVRGICKHGDDIRVCDHCFMAVNRTCNDGPTCNEIEHLEIVAMEKTS